MTDLTHARCGGRLIPIADPPWFERPDPQTGAWHLAAVVFVRCDRCDLRGELTGKEELPASGAAGSS